MHPTCFSIQVQVSIEIEALFDNDDNVDTIVELQPYHDDCEREAYPAFPFLSRKSTPFYLQIKAFLYWSIQ